MKRRNVLLFRVSERVKKIASCKDPKKKSELEGERSEFRQKTLEVTNNMHPQVRNAIKLVEQMIKKMLADYVKLNYNISQKKKLSLVVKDNSY